MSLMGGVIQWQGLIGADPDGFCHFDTLANGLRAGAMSLHSAWARHKHRTIRQIICGTPDWPGWSQTDQEAYVENLANWLNLHPDSLLELDQRSQLAGLMQGIIRQENGQIACSFVAIVTAADAALEACK